MTSDLSRRLLEGDKRALSRALSLIENGYSEGRELFREIYSHTGKGQVIGVTGPAGAGKSTLVRALTRELRKRQRRIGIVAVDPTSPFTHGALLGDRIRMQDLTSDPEVFIRSMATRGALGGLSATTSDAAAVMQAAGKEVVIVETVGAGQDEVEVATMADTTIVISIPGAGDDIQAIKAGILEIADILVVNKADLPGADTIAKQLHIYLSMDKDAGWTPPIIKTVAHKDSGIVELADAVEGHFEYMKESGRLEEVRRQRARRQLLAIAQGELINRVLRATKDDGLDDLVELIARRVTDPHTAASRLIEAAETKEAAQT